MYPNPVREVLYISVLLPVSYEATLYMPTGVPVLSAVSPASLEMSVLPPGVYFLSIFFHGTTHLYRLLKE